jgi:hypothetical protein
MIAHPEQMVRHFIPSIRLTAWLTLLAIIPARSREPRVHPTSLEASEKLLNDLYKRVRLMTPEPTSSPTSEGARSTDLLPHSCTEEDLQMFCANPILEAASIKMYNSSHPQGYHSLVRRCFPLLKVFKGYQITPRTIAFAHITCVGAITPTLCMQAVKSELIYACYQSVRAELLAPKKHSHITSAFKQDWLSLRPPLPSACAIYDTQHNPQAKSLHCEERCAENLGAKWGKSVLTGQCIRAPEGNQGADVCAEVRLELPASQLSLSSYYRGSVDAFVTANAGRFTVHDVAVAPAWAQAWDACVCMKKCGKQRVHCAAAGCSDSTSLAEAILWRRYRPFCCFLHAQAQNTGPDGQYYRKPSWQYRYMFIDPSSPIFGDHPFDYVSYVSHR